MQNITNPETARIGRIKVVNPEAINNDVHFTIVEAAEATEGNLYPLDCCQFVQKNFTNIVGRAGYLRPYDPNEQRHEPESFSVEQWQQTVRDNTIPCWSDEAQWDDRFATEPGR